MIAMEGPEMEDGGCGIPSSCIVSLQPRHDSSNHLLVLESGGFTYLSAPPSKSMEEGKLCFLDHRMESRDSVSDMCCLREAGHVHAHVHHGDVTEEILLQQCMEEACCTLPMRWDMGSIRSPIVTADELDSDHEHKEECGHNRIAHGDHFDWLIPQDDGSYVLKYAQAAVNGVSRFMEHGRLVKVGESLGQLKKRPKQLVNVFTYESPNRKGYESLPTTEEMLDTEIVAFVTSPSSDCMASSSPKQAPVVQEDVKLTIPRGFKGQGMKKTTFDVMGICCASEIPLVKKILEPLPGVEEVFVNPTSKAVTVLHDPTIVADVQLVKILNEARLDASIHQRGKRRIAHKWPTPWTIGSGILLLISFIHYAWSPLQWFALGSVAVGVPPILLRSLVALRRRVLDINALMIIAVAGAIALGDYVEAGAICFLFTSADWLESRSSTKALDALSNVAELAPQTAVLMDGQRVGVDDVRVGTLLAVKAGELVPIDGEVVSGKSSIDESNVTGESRPVEKTMGAVVWAGTMNLSGYISVKTIALAEDSTVSRMVRQVEEAQNQHSQTEQLVEKCAKYYTPVVVLAALLIAVIPLAVGADNRRHWIYLALVLLVVSCPCALVISTPVTITCGIAQAARSGLLVRGGSYLEALGKVKVLALDKTGTLTEGHFRVLDVHPIDSETSVQQILYWIACVEIKSSHPLAPALVAYARLHGVEPTGDISDFEIIPGLGVSAVVDGCKVQIGNARLAASFVGFEGLNSEIVNTWNSLGATIGWVGVNDRPVGVFGVADSVRPEAIEAVASLKKLGMRVVMLTGDSAAAASVVHIQIGDIEVHSQLLPEDKVKLVKELQATGVTAMVGDGINDAPALALADVGIAMGVAGSAVAMETSDVALMTNDLRKLVVAMELGRNVRLKIIQNVSLSFFTKLTIIILAAVGYPSLWAAIVADVGTCLVVIFNSMRLLNRKKGVVLPKFESNKHRGRKLCIRDSFESSCYSEKLEAGSGSQFCSGKDAEKKCYSSSDKKLEAISTGQCFSGKDAEKKCCSSLDKKLCSSLDKKLEAGSSGQCFSEKDAEKKCCSSSYKRRCSSSDKKLEAGSSGQWFSGKDAEKKCCSSSDKKIEAGSGSQFCSGKDAEKKCCSSSDKKRCSSLDKKLEVGSSGQCFSEKDAEKKCCSSSDKKLEAGSGSQCRSGKDAEKKCCSSSDKKRCSSSEKKLEAGSSGQCFSDKDAEKKCCSSSDKKLEAGSGSQCCSGKDAEKKCCSRSDKKRCSSSDKKLEAGSSGQCFSGKDAEKKCCSSSDKKLEAGSGSQCCSGKDVEKKCCSSSDNKRCSSSDKKLEAGSSGQCFSGKDAENKYSSSSDKKLEAGSGSQCCSGKDAEKKCCSSSDKKRCSSSEKKLETGSSGQCISGKDAEKKCCSSSDKKLEAGSGSQCRSGKDAEKTCCSSSYKKRCSSSEKTLETGSSGQCFAGKDAEKKCCPSSDKKLEAGSGSQCCSGKDAEKKCC